MNRAPAGEGAGRCQPLDTESIADITAPTRSTLPRALRDHRELVMVATSSLNEGGPPIGTPDGIEARHDRY